MAIVKLALLADFAVAHPDGKLYVTGGGIRTLSFAGFPATRTRLALALGLEFSKDALQEAHTLSIQVVAPNEEQVIKPIVGTLTPITELPAGQSGYFHFVTTIDEITFPIEGQYRFVITIDGEQQAALPLEVERLLGFALPPELQAAAKLQDGYEAWARGDADAAMEIFRDITVRFPGVAAAHNNLGFVLLAEGDAAGAEEAFSKARELAFSQPELLDANMACAQYLKNEPSSAQTLFDHCLRSYGFGGRAVLFGICTEQLFPVQLQSASDYVALMRLNLAWSALRAGDPSAAIRQVGGAEASDLCQRQDESGTRFALSVAALKAELQQTPPAAGAR